MEAEQQEVKRLKFSKDEEEDEDEEDEEEEQEVDTLRPSHATCLSKEAEAMVQEEEEKVEYSKENEASSSAAATEDQGRLYWWECIMGCSGYTSKMCLFHLFIRRTELKLMSLIKVPCSSFPFNFVGNVEVSIHVAI